MKKILEFLKTTTIGGLVVLVPVSVVVYVLGIVLVQVQTVTRTVADRLGYPPGRSTLLVLLVAVLLIVATCFAAGLLVRTRLGRALGGWARRHVARRIPMYETLSNVTKSLTGMQAGAMPTVEVDLYGSGARVLGFLVEELPGERCAVFVPASPVPTIGQVYVVPRLALRELPVTLGSTLNAISQWGVEAKTLYRDGSASTPAAD